MAAVYGNTSSRATWTFLSREKFDLSHFRALFYLIDPREIQKERSDSLASYYIDTIPVFLLVCFAEFIATFLITGRVFRLNDAITSWSAAILSHMTKLCVTGFEIAIYTWIFVNYRVTTLALDTWATWIAALLATDFGYYWLHRASHEINLLWSAHQVHHSSEEFNLSVAVRQSAVSHFFAWIFYLPMAFIGFTPANFLVHRQFNLLYQFWIHTSLIRNLGFLELFLNTPSHHRAHHARNPLYIDVNYGGVLIVWDRLFGTFQAEDPNEPECYGLVGRITSHNAIHVQTVRFEQLWLRLRTYKKLTDKLSAVFKSPRWEPGLGFYGILDRTVALRVKEWNPEVIYNPKVPIWMNIYATLHFAAVLPYFYAMLRSFERGTNWTVFDTVVTFFHVALALGQIGSVFDDRPWVPLAEMVRCGGMAVIFTSLPGFEALHMGRSLVFALRILFVGSLCLWPVIGRVHVKFVYYNVGHGGEHSTVMEYIPKVVIQTSKLR